MSKRVLILLGHPDADSFCAALAEAHAQGLREAGHELRWLRLGELDFDPILHQGYRRIQPLEPDLVAAQADILWAEHLVFVYPIWWGTMPALLKGFFDRVFLPGFAFKYRRDSAFWDRLLKGRSARLLVSMDTPPWYYRWVYRMPGHQQMRQTILEFCGISPVQISDFGPLRGSAPQRRERWLARVRWLGRRT